MGAYEFQAGVSGQFIAWLQQYGLPTNGSADYTDADGDGMNNWQEWRCQPTPTNSLSVLKIVPPTPSDNGFAITWQSVAGVNYFLQRATNLATPAQFIPLATGIPGQAGTTTYTDTPAIGAGQFFYRVGVGN
jgi:hypothetical protein